jgi:hypothetical protein
VETLDIILISTVHAPEGGGKEKRIRVLELLVEWDERDKYTHSVICMSAKPLSIISPRKMIACGRLLFATRHALRKFISTKIRDTALRSELRPG